MLGVRLLVVALLAVVVGLPALAQDEPEDITPPSVEAPADAPAEEAPPAEQPAPQPAAPTAAPVSPTPRPSVAATPVPGPGTVVFSDNFDDVTRPNFPLTSASPNARSQGYVEGEYEILSGTAAGESTLVPGTYTNSTIAIDVRVTGGPITARAYVSCRRGGANEGYQFNIQPGRADTVRSDFVGPRFQLVKLREGPDVTLIDQGPVPAIRDKGEVNHIELTCAGSTITGSINGTEVLSVLDSTYTSGRHRFGVAGAQSRGRFDDLVVTLR